jgi:hypothetical protein
MAKKTPTKKRRAEKFIKDLIIAGDDGKLYYLSESAWKANAKPASAFDPVIIDALRAGVALAAVPEHEGDPMSVDASAAAAPAKSGKAAKSAKKPAKGQAHPLGFCYLVNLASLKTHTSFED